MDEEDEEESGNERNQSNMGMRAPIIGYEIVDNRQKFTVRLGIWPVYIALIFICFLGGLIFLIKFSWLRYMIYKSKESIVSALATFYRTWYFSFPVTHSYSWLWPTTWSALI